MLEMVKGCVVPNNKLLFEQYQAEEWGYFANVHASKIENLIRVFVTKQKVPIFFILELPTKADEEKLLRADENVSFHKDVYYLDGLDELRALALLDRYGELLIQDGMVSFGFGAHDGSAEITLGKYNIITLWARDPKEYEEFFEDHGIGRVEHCVTAWDLFRPDAAGECRAINVNGMSVFDLPEVLKADGLYFAERRED